MTGLFITLEGVEGAGKSSAIKFLAEILQVNKIDFLLTREPGGTEIAEKIRKVLLDHYNETMHPDTEMLLYFAGRAQHLYSAIIPALNQGRWVICDRFTDASYAYQGGGRGLSQEKIAILENFVQGALRPNYTFLLDVDPAIGLKRIRKNRVLDRFEVEKEEFFNKVRACYLQRAKNEPQRYLVIDANKTQNEVKLQIQDALQKICAEFAHVSS